MMPRSGLCGTWQYLYRVLHCTAISALLQPRLVLLLATDAEFTNETARYGLPLARAFQRTQERHQQGTARYCNAIPYPAGFLGSYGLARTGCCRWGAAGKTLGWRGAQPDLDTVVNWMGGGAV